MFSKILIANRGEIACRIIRSCRALGIKTVSVYSEIDQNALHVTQADEAVFIGPSPPQHSYLKVEKILEAALKKKAEAIHPGYGFLSENADFAEKIEQAGLTLIGPRSAVIRLMGDKIKAREAAVKSGATIAPGSRASIQTLEEAHRIAQEIGYPLLIKAAAGGGGKGMRVAYEATQLQEGMEAAQREALSSFGDDRIFIEKFIERPRHIEIQILADHYGNIAHLGERECSLQRRHQKVIEESPSPFLDSASRAQMTNQAVNLAKAVNYTSAGTVEFIVDQNRNFYFLEMNTRLQVEHAVTEMITGRDLVSDMILIAAGQPLNFTQKEVVFKGHAVEARIYGEDPSLDFIPSPGKLYRYQPPDECRVDSGVEEGDEVSLYYDPMISKVIAHRPTRTEAFQALSLALNKYVIEGCGNNIFFLNALANHPKVLQGDIHTHFIAEEFPHNFNPQAIPDEKLLKLFKTCAALVFGKKNNLETIVLKKEEEVESYALSSIKSRIIHRIRNLACLEDEKKNLHWLQVKLDAVTVEISGYGYMARFDAYSERFEPYLKYLPKPAPLLEERFVVTPMPGKLILLSVKIGETLKIGQAVAIIEAMKMENILRSPRPGMVKRIFATEGQILESKQNILEIE